MSCQNNANRSRIAAAKCGVSKITSKATYSLAVAGWSAVGAAAGTSALGPGAGTLIGATIGGAAGAKMINRAVEKGKDEDQVARRVATVGSALAGWTIGGVIGGMDGSQAGAALGISGTRALATGSEKSARKARRSAVSLLTVAGGSVLGAALGSAYGPVGTAGGFVGGRAAGKVVGNKINAAYEKKMAEKRIQWEASPEGKQAKQQLEQTSARVKEERKNAVEAVKDAPAGKRIQAVRVFVGTMKQARRTRIKAEQRYTITMKREMKRKSTEE